MKVITHGYTDGSRVSACPRHAAQVSDYTVGGASYAGVHHGLHDGRCDFCDDSADTGGE